MTEEQKKLTEENHNLIYFVLHKHNLPIDEYYDILAISLCKSCIHYDANKSKFATFAVHNMEQDLKIEFRRKNTIKRSKFTTISYNTPIPGLEGLEFKDILQSSNDILDYLILVDFQKFTEREMELLKLIIQGYNQKEIADFMNISQPQVSRLTNKLRRKIEDEN